MSKAFCVSSPFPAGVLPAVSVVSSVGGEVGKGSFLLSDDRIITLKCMSLHVYAEQRGQIQVPSPAIFVKISEN